MNINLDYLKKNQNDVILVKKKNKSQRVATDFWLGFAGSAGSTCRVIRVTPSHDFSYFFFNPTLFQSLVNRVPDRLVG